MSVWNQLLESMHSALIDELVQLHPEPKPELGMPSRHRGYGLFSGSPYATCTVSLEKKQGAIFLLLDSKASNDLKMSASELLTKVLKRAQTEFSRRGIVPEIGLPRVVDPANNANQEQSPSVLISIPFRLRSGFCHLGIAM